MGCLRSSSSSSGGSSSSSSGSSSGGGGGGGTSSSGTSSSSGSSGGDSFNTAEERYRASLQQPRARTVQAARPKPAAAEPRTRGQKRSADEAQEYEDPWWQRVSNVDSGSDNETSTGNSPRAPSTRSSLLVWDADAAVQEGKRANVNAISSIRRRAMHGGSHHVFTQAVKSAQLYNAGVPLNKYKG